MIRMNQLNLTLVSIVLSMNLVLAGAVQADLIGQHAGSESPVNEGFGEWPFNGGLSAIALPDDAGEQAWQIANTSLTAQALYIQVGGVGPYLGGSGLTAAEIDDVKTDGFILTMRARVISGPVYDESGSQQISAFISVAGFSEFRFELGLGTDGSGNTIVVLAQSISPDGGGFKHAPFGSTIFVTGNDYHTYQLSYDPTSLEADLRIDGVVRATGYPGSGVSGGAVSPNIGLFFGTVNLATANFAMAKLESGQVPEVPALGFPGTAALGAALLAVMHSVLGACPGFLKQRRVI